MIFLEWRDEWTFGIAFMDDDHRALAAMLNQIADDFSPLRSQDVDETCPSHLIEALERLAQHVREHFRREEDVMRTHGYPMLAAHKSEHDQLLAEFSILVRDIRQRAVSQLDHETFDVLKDWLMGHVLELDRPLAEFLRDLPPPTPDD